MLHATRRRFMGRLIAAGTAATAPHAFAQKGPVDEAAEQAVALGYQHDTTNIDGKKYWVFKLPRSKAPQRTASR